MTILYMFLCCSIVFSTTNIVSSDPEKNIHTPVATAVKLLLRIPRHYYNTYSTMRFLDKNRLFVQRITWHDCPADEYSFPSHPHDSDAGVVALARREETYEFSPNYTKLLREDYQQEGISFMQYCKLHKEISESNAHDINNITLLQKRFGTIIPADSFLGSATCNDTMVATTKCTGEIMLYLITSQILEK